MRAKILFVLVLLVLFAGSTFAIPSCVGSPASKCGYYTQAVCSNYFDTTQGCGNLQCIWDTSPPGCRQEAEAPSHCWWGGTTLKTTSECSNVATSVCTQYCDTVNGTYCVGPCYVDTVPAPACEAGGGWCEIPEFFGIEFGEMSISTGVIALIAAIILPAFLFRRKK